MLLCCLRNNWCHVGCSYETHLGRVCPCQFRILDPKRKIIVLSHPYMEDYVVLSTRAGVRPETRLSVPEIETARHCVRMRPCPGSVQLDWSTFWWRSVRGSQRALFGCLKHQKRAESPQLRIGQQANLTACQHFTSLSIGKRAPSYPDL